MPLWGEAMTMCTPDFDRYGKLTNPCAEMLGRFSMVLKEVSDVPGKGYMKLAGPMRGETNPDQTLNHILGDKDARGLIYSFGDTLLESIPLDECNIKVKEDINVTLGTGLYSGANGIFTITGQLNICTGVNVFDMETGNNQLCFDQPFLKP
jgi:hypothetical protein